MDLMVKLAGALIYGSLVATYATRSLLGFVEMHKATDLAVAKEASKKFSTYGLFALLVASSPWTVNFIVNLMN